MHFLEYPVAFGTHSFACLCAVPLVCFIKWISVNIMSIISSYLSNGTKCFLRQQPFLASRERCFGTWIQPSFLSKSCMQTNYEEYNQTLQWNYLIYSSWCWNICRCCISMICQIVCFMPVVIIIPPRPETCSLTNRWFQTDTMWQCPCPACAGSPASSWTICSTRGEIGTCWRGYPSEIPKWRVNLLFILGCFFVYFEHVVQLYDMYIYILCFWFVYFQFESFFLLWPCPFLAEC